MTAAQAQLDRQLVAAHTQHSVTIAELPDIVTRPSQSPIGPNLVLFSEARLESHAF